ncbi:MAG: hypothetical protein IT384_01500 [Deltaproteobacteria bacterium]|nr:hypothetical protein [Deltaproteobacteria bacterium]
MHASSIQVTLAAVRIGSAAWLVLAPLAACGENGTLVFASGDADLTMILVEIDDQPATVELAFSTPEAIRRAVPENASGLSLAALRFRDLAALPGVDPSRVSGVRVRLGRPPDDAMAVEQQDVEVFRLVAIPSASDIHSAVLRGRTPQLTPDPERSERMRASVTLLLPALRESCPPATLRSFARLSVPTVHLVHRVAEDLVVLLTRRALFLVRRGGEVLATVTATEAGLTDTLSFASLNALPSPAAGPWSFWAGTCPSDGSGGCVPGQWEVLRLELDPRGLRSIETATVFGANKSLKLVGSGFGSAFAYLDSGHMYWMDAEPFAVQALTPPGGVTAAQVIDGIGRTDDRARPFLLALTDHVYVVQRSGSDWPSWTLEAPDTARTFVAAGAHDATTGDFELWAGGSAGIMYRKPAGARVGSRLPLALPPRILPCAGSPTQLAFDVSSIRVTRRDVFVAIEVCSAAIRIRRDDLCVSTMAEDDHQPRPSRIETLRLGQASFGWLTVWRQTTEALVVLETPVEE